MRSYVEGKGAAGVTFFDKLSSKDSIYGFIFVTIEDASEKYPNAKTAIEQIASNELKKDILERSTVIINGIPGELIVYSHKLGVIEERLPYESSKIIRINRTVYFDHSGLIWGIEIESDEDKAEQAKADFEHLLETFRILD
jgi:uncharacterized protein YjbK